MRLHVKIERNFVEKAAPCQANSVLPAIALIHMNELHVSLK